MTAPAWGTPPDEDDDPPIVRRFVIVGLLPEPDGDGGTRYRRWIGEADGDDPRAVEDAARESEPGLLVAAVLYGQAGRCHQADGYAVFSDPDLTAPED